MIYVRKTIIAISSRSLGGQNNYFVMTQEHDEMVDLKIIIIVPVEKNKKEKKKSGLSS